jgi:hypothetical protein
VVLVILGDLASVAVLAITRFMGMHVEAANTEVPSLCRHLLLRRSRRKPTDIGAAGEDWDG